MHLFSLIVNVSLMNDALPIHLQLLNHFVSFLWVFNHILYCVWAWLSSFEYVLLILNLYQTWSEICTRVLTRLSGVGLADTFSCIYIHPFNVDWTWHINIICVAGLVEIEFGQGILRFFSHTVFSFSFILTAFVVFDFTSLDFIKLAYLFFTA